MKKPEKIRFRNKWEHCIIHKCFYLELLSFKFSINTDSYNLWGITILNFDFQIWWKLPKTTVLIDP